MSVPRQYDAEAMFLYWYNDGERRTLVKVAEQFGCGYDTVKKYSSEDDWNGRADEIDAEVIEQVNRQLASTRARRTVRAVRILDTVESHFLERLRLGQATPNDPAALTPADVGISDVLRVQELRDKLLGGVTHRLGVEGGADHLSLAEIENEIAEMDKRELEGGTDGKA